MLKTYLFLLAAIVLEVVATTALGSRLITSK